MEKQAVKALNKAGLAAFETQVRARFNIAATAKPAADGVHQDRSASARRRWADALRTVYIQQRNVEAYLAIAQPTGLTAADCHAIARLLLARRKPADALAWVDRGLGIEKTAPHEFTTAYDLRKLQCELFVKLGRASEALEAAWAEFRAHPSRCSYDDLMTYVPKALRSSWHTKAITAATQADLETNLDSVIELLTETNELEQLADLVRETGDAALEGMSHYVTEPAARRLQKRYPGAAARLWCTQGMRILSAKKSKYYDTALEHFERGKDCYERAGLVPEWEKIVSFVRTRHHRKMGFMSGFENLIAGSGPSTTPSFLERAKAKWSDRQRKNGP